MSAVRRAPELRALETALRARGVDEGTALALVLGSGLGTFAERIEGARTIPYAELEGMPRSAVPGHAGRLVVGSVRGVRVVAQQGRVHLYEGWDVQEVTRAVRAFAAVGVRGLFLSNAAGGLHADWAPGTLMRITDHLNLQSTSPALARERGFASPYDPALGAALDAAAAETGVALERGVYAGLLGPSYETPAEIRFLRRLGADAVGMSTVAEAVAGHAAGMRVAAVSCVTNPGAGLAPGKLDHADVVAAGKAASESFATLLEAAVPRMT